jgi:hypothetical protein
VESGDIQKFLNGDRPKLSEIPYVMQRKGEDIGNQRISFDSKKPYMTNGNGSGSDSSFLFRSVLTKWDQAHQATYNPGWIDQHSIAPNYPKGMFQAMGQTLEQLYQYAYFGRKSWDVYDTTLYGKYFKNITLEINDSSLFQYNSNGENVFCYSLILPPEIGTKENLQKAMQRDLETYFGFNASIKTRKFPCWRLVASKEAITKLATNGGDQKIETLIPHVSYKFSNVPVKRLVQYFLVFTDDVILDETSITQNVDFTSEECIDFESLKAFLPKYGLKLIPAEREMKVLVIRDTNRADKNVTGNYSEKRGH